jgi:hypothetical protein
MSAGQAGIGSWSSVLREGSFLRAIFAAGLLLLGLAIAPGSASAEAEWKIDAASNTAVAAGGQHDYFVTIGNVGPTDSDAGQVSLAVSLPPGVTAISQERISPLFGPDFSCPDLGVSNEFDCTADLEGLSGEIFGQFSLRLKTEVAPDLTGHLTASFGISGGGASPDSTVDATRISSTPPGFGVDSFDVRPGADRLGTAYLRAGGHPYDFTTDIRYNSVTHPARGPLWSPGTPRDIGVDLPPGFVGAPSALGECTVEQIADPGKTRCPSSSQVGLVEVDFNGRPAAGMVPLYNMVPPVGVPARLGFSAAQTLITLDAALRADGDYGLTVTSRKTPEAFNLVHSSVTIWGDPSDPAHDFQRACPGLQGFVRGCSTNRSQPFLRMPTSCTPQGQGLPFDLRTDSWEDPGAYATASMQTHLSPGFPYLPDDWGLPRGAQNCDAVPVRAEIQAQPTALDAETASGLAVHVEVPNPGIKDAAGAASSDIKKAVVTLPEGMTVNPSQAEGLGSCSVARYQSTELSFFPTPDTGCPDDSKIGTVQVKTPLLEETIPGDVYVAEPYANQFGSLLALYVVMREPNRGIMVKLAGKVETDERTGQITAIFDQLPQLPFDSFDFKFREGARAPLVTPRACSTYTTAAKFSGWSAPNSSITRTSSFQVARGIGGGPCPPGGIPPFKPGLIAGSLNNNAGAFSPFNIRVFRNDGEQEMVDFSIKLPPGITAKLAGVPFCPDAAIAAAKTRSGAAELASPSCPAASEVGRTLAGAGVGPVQTYVPGKLYLAGPYHGSALSAVAITAAKVGPFDLGTVILRAALKVNPETAEVFVDPTGSDPIPHIIDGIATHIRDVRAYVERPGFVLNPTSCKPTSTAATVLGAGLDFTSAADDQPVTITTRYQAADCASLGFKPKLALRLLGGTKRGQHPQLKAVLTARKGDANIAKAKVTLPHSEFLAQSHIRTICTRAQFKEGTVPGEKCPPGSIYGYAKAITPLLDEPIEGPVFLRSSSNPLPDLVAALHSGRIDVNVVGRIDSVGKDGQIRNSFEAVPDAPVTKFTLTMQGGKKGLLENSTNLCRKKNRAIAAFTGQNGKAHDFKPLLQAKCAKGSKKR